MYLNIQKKDLNQLINVIIVINMDIGFNKFESYLFNQN